MFTPIAPDHSFEVVGALSLSGSAAGVCIEDALYTLEEFFADNWLVSSLVLDALVGDFADVVAVTQHPVEGFAGDRLVASRGFQAEVNHKLVQAVKSVQSGAKQLKCLAVSRSIKVLGSERIQGEPEAAEELIQRCVHLPTALHIAAARVKAEPHTSLGVLVGQLRDQRQRLAALSTRDSQYFDIRAVFSWSYIALSPQAARLFRLLGLHPGPDIGTLAAASLAGLPEHETRQLLTDLTRAYLLEGSTPGRYSFHDLLSAYATEQAHIEEPQPQQQEALHRVLDHYLHTGFTGSRHLNPHWGSITGSVTLEAPQPEVTTGQVSDYQQTLEWFTAEHAALLAAINHAARQGFDTHAWQLPWALATFLSLRGHRHDYITTHQIALAAADRLGDPTTQATSHGGLGFAQISLRHYTDAAASFQQALTLYEDLGDRDGQTDIHLALGMVCERQGRYTEAIAHTQHALDLARATGNRVWQANALNNLGWYHTQLGDYQQALTYCQQALNLDHELDDHRGEAATLDSLGYVHHHLGHYDEAITYYQQSITLYRKLDDHYCEADILTHLADTYYTTGNITAARQAWQQALTIFEQSDHPDAEQVRTKLDTLTTGPDTNHS